MPAPVVANADDLTVSMNAMRTGWDPNQPGLAPSQVGASDFGELFSTTVDGQVYAQPIVAGSVVVVATENNHAYGINATSGAIVWSRSFGAAWPASAIGCGDLIPNIGVTSTPVCDSSPGIVYLTAKVNDGPDVNHPHWYMYALDVTTGNVKTGWPVIIQGAPTNDPGHPFNPFTAMQRAGLLLLDGVVYAGFGSHCDHQPYVGYVVGVNTTTRTITMWATEDAASGTEAGVWMSGSGLVSDGAGRILFSTGNGISPAPGPGNHPPGHLAESVVRLQVNADGSLTAQDFFSPSNAPSLDQGDQDLGSGGPAALPSPPFGTPAHPDLLVQVGKDGRVFLLDRDNLGGRSQGPGGSDLVLAVTGPFHGVWGHPGVWGGDGGYVYTVENQGFLRALKYGLSGSGAPVLSSVGTSGSTFGYTSGSPIVTSTGSASGSALVWVVYSTGPTGSGAQLRAYDAVPINGVLKLRWSAPIGTAVKFAVPAVAAGRVYVGTRDGHLLAFGRPANAALTGGPLDFGPVAVGSAVTQTMTVTATRTVTVNAITTTAPFAATTARTLPVTLNTGDAFTTSVIFTPTEPGAATATLSYDTTVGGNPGSVGIDLHGTGTQPGFAASPRTLDFGQLPTGTSTTLTVNITNTGTTSETVADTTAPSGPFTATGLPAAGTSVAAQASVAVSVTYTPTAPSGPGGDTSGLTVTGTDHRSVTVPVIGSAITGAPHLTISPTTIDFGQTPVGESVTRAFDISNTGNIVLTITKAAPPTVPFAANNPIAEGQQLNPGDVIHQSITFAPSSVGAATGTYLITGNDGQGQQTVTFGGTGAQPSDVTIPAPDAGGWTFNGSAQLSGSDLVLTSAENNTAGSAVFGTPILSEGLRARFTAVIGGGTGADGLALVLLDPAKTSPQALGAGGGGLGYAGLPGVAVALDTFQNTDEPSSNFVGVATGGTGDTLTYAATSTAIGPLRTGTHTVGVDITTGTLMVTVDGTKVLSPTISLPPAVLIGFTGATGGLSDIHTARNVVITSPAYATTPPDGPNWTFNGSAQLSGSDLMLTPALNGQAGSALYNTPIPSGRLLARFTAAIGGGTGADGLALLLLDPARTTPHALGAVGGGLGYAGLPGVAITLDTFQNSGEPSSNFVGVATAGAGDALTYVATSTAIGPLRTGTHAAQVRTTADGHVIVTIDGAQIIDTVVPLPTHVLVGFSAATGGLNDQHSARNVTIGYH